MPTDLPNKDYYSEEYLRQQAIQARSFHPTGAWEAFPQSALASSIVARFEEMVARYPDRLAVKSQRLTLTYAQLNQVANVVADQLLVTLPDTKQPFVICCQHDVPALVAAIGILKAGKIYVCLDHHSPLTTNRKIIDEVNPICILTDRSTCVLAEQLAQPGLATIDIEELDWQAKPNWGSTYVAAPTDLAYITYTSGTTGRPKGVVEDHQDVLHYCMLFVNQFHFCPADRVLAITHFSAGGSWVSIYPILLSGGSVFLFDVKQEGAAALAEWIVSEAITCMALPVVLFRVLAPMLPDKSQLPHLRLLGLGGGAMRPTDIQLYQRHCPAHTLLRTAYGCTEAHFICCYFMDKESPLPDGPTPLGYPTGDGEILILDESGEPVAARETGEIAVRRTYLTPGYWNNPTLTATRYSVDPEQPGKRTYHVGDRGCLRADGCLLYLGRMDNQVKVRGHFIDLDHFEQMLAQLDGVQQAAAIVEHADDGQTMLLVYLQRHPNNHATVSFFYKRLAAQLPGHMLPHAILLVDEMPITASGKIDRRALPKPTTSRPLLATPYCAPKTALQRRLVTLWQELLHIEPIGIDDHLLELGVDSLRAMMIINRLQEFSTNFLYVYHLFEAPTIATFSLFLTQHYPTTAQTLAGEVAVESLATTDKELQQRARLDATVMEEIRGWLTIFQRQVSVDNVMPTAKNPSAVFVLSPPRSGSTLFRILLAGHPQLFAPPELGLLAFNTLQEQGDLLSPPGGGKREGVLRALMAAKDCDAEAAQALLATMEEENLTTQEFYRRLQAWIAPRHLVDKTPYYAYALETLNQAEAEFEQPRYVHLVRHPFGMIHSYVNDQTALRLLSSLRYHSSVAGLPSLTEKLPFPAEAIAEAVWLISQQNIATFLATIPTARRLLVHFEELVRQPKAVLQEICAFLAIPFHPAMLAPYDDPNTRMTDGIHAFSQMLGDTKFKTHKQIDATVADRWQADYTNDFLSERTWQTAESLGYRRMDLSPTDNPQAQAATPVATDDLEELVAQLEALSDDEATTLLHSMEGIT